MLIPYRDAEVTARQNAMCAEIEAQLKALTPLSNPNRDSNPIPNPKPALASTLTLTLTKVPTPCASFMAHAMRALHAELRRLGRYVHIDR